MIDAPQHRHSDDDGTGAGKHGSHQEEGAQDGGVPAWLKSHSEDPRDDSVHDDDQHGHEYGHSPQDLLQATVLLWMVLPAQRQEAVHVVLPAGYVCQPVPAAGDVGQEREVEEDDAGEEVQAHTGHVPQKGGLEPSVEENVEHAVNTAQVHQDAARAERDAEDGDGLSRAGQRLAPLGPYQAQNGGYEGAGVGQADEEDEVDDVHAPVDRTVHPGHDQAVSQLANVGHAPPDDDGQ
jgi:hypothetical protein